MSTYLGYVLKTFQFPHCDDGELFKQEFFPVVESDMQFIDTTEIDKHIIDKHIEAGVGFAHTVEVKCHMTNDEQTVRTELEYI